MKKKILDKILNTMLLIVASIFIYVILNSWYSFVTSGMKSEIPLAEQTYINNTLSKITYGLSEDEVVEILGPPSRILPFKLNWWVTIDSKPNRVGVLFSIDGNGANEIILDGGPGKFYYRKELVKISSI